MKTAAIMAPERSTRRLGISLLLGAGDQALVSGATFACSVILGRLAGADQLGVYALGGSFAFFAMGLQDAAVSSSYVIHSKHLAPEERQTYAGSAFLQSIALAAAVGLLAIAMLAASTWFPSLAGWSAPAMVLLAFGPPALLRQFARKVCLADGSAPRAFAIDGVATLLQLLGLAALIFLDRLQAITAAAVAGAAFSVAVVYWWTRARTELRVQPSAWRRDLSRSLSEGKWILACRMVALSHRHVALWLLAAIGAANSVGVFAACVTIVSAANVLLFGLANVLEPRLAEAYSRHGLAAVQEVTRRTTFLLTTTIGLFALCLFVAGGPLLQWLYLGPEYQGQSITLTALALAMWIEGIMMAWSQMLRVTRNSPLNLRANLAAAVFSLILAVVLIPDHGVTGAAFSILGGAVVSAALRFFYYRQVVGRSA